jgi:ornithine carbamoyltransferase
MRHFLAIADYSPAELEQLLDLARRLKKEWRRGRARPLLKGQVLGMVFQKPSLRTRVSFDMAMRQLGGDALYLSPAEVGLGQREAVQDVARVLSGYVQAIMARTFDHQLVLDLARWATVPVINGLSDYNHPCQALADMLTILEVKGRLRGLKVAYVGDGNNVANSLLHFCAKVGAHFTCASPAGYDLSEDVLDSAHPFAQASGASLSLTRDPLAAVSAADVVYTDTWVSMGEEAEAAQRLAVFPPYQVNAQLLSAAKPDAMVLHCLPAHRGQEITDAVIDGPQSAVFPQAENRLHAQKALLAYLLAADQLQPRPRPAPAAYKKIAGQSKRQTA